MGLTAAEEREQGLSSGMVWTGLDWKGRVTLEWRHSSARKPKHQKGRAKGADNKETALVLRDDTSEASVF